MTEKINIKENIKNYRIRELQSKILYWEGRRKESDRLIIKYQDEINELNSPELNYIGSGEHKQLGFEWEGFFITDPFDSTCGRFAVNPLFEYGLTIKQAKRIKHENMLDVDLDFHLTLPKTEENKNEV